jgi:hypothetical protein
MVPSLRINSAVPTFSWPGNGGNMAFTVITEYVHVMDSQA